MPMYTYECQTCGTVFDQLGGFEERETNCQKLMGDMGDLDSRCGGIAKRIPSIPAPAKFNCPMPTAPTKYHKHGRS